MRRKKNAGRARGAGAAGKSKGAHGPAAEHGDHGHTGHGHAGHGHAGHGHAHGGHSHGGRGHDRHGNPRDLARYLSRLDDPERIDWQKPDEVVAALGLRPGDTVGEVGAGSGYFTLRLAAAVGPKGRVLAAEVAPKIMAVLKQRLRKARVANVEPVLADPSVPPFPAGSCRRILIVNTFHHFPDGVAYLRALAGCLARGGRIVNVDFHKRELPMGPPPELKISREEFLEQAGAAGLRLAEERDFLPHQYFLALRRR